MEKSDGINWLLVSLGVLLNEGVGDINKEESGEFVLSFEKKLFKGALRLTEFCAYEQVAITQKMSANPQNLFQKNISLHLL